MSSAITNLASPFPSSILSSLTGTIVWNAVTLALAPSKSRPGSADGEEIGFSRRSISPTGACPELGMGIHQGYETEATFHLLHSGKRVHVPGDVDILICPRVGTPRGPISTHARTRVKPFNVSSNSPVMSRRSKSKDFPPTVCLSKFGQLHPRVLIPIFLQENAWEQRSFNPTSSTLSTSATSLFIRSALSRTPNYKFPAAPPFKVLTTFNMSTSITV